MQNEEKNIPVHWREREALLRNLKGHRIKRKVTIPLFKRETSGMKRRGAENTKALIRRNRELLA